MPRSLRATEFASRALYSLVLELCIPLPRACLVCRLEGLESDACCSCPTQTTHVTVCRSLSAQGTVPEGLRHRFMVVGGAERRLAALYRQIRLDLSTCAPSVKQPCASNRVPCHGIARVYPWSLCFRQQVILCACAKQDMHACPHADRA